MGVWGMGLAQSDEYCEVYETFMEAYDDGGEPEKIAVDILEQYLDEFDADDGVLHDVYFALAKAQWMCQALEPGIYDRVKEIIEKGENIDFYRELEATEADLRLRQKNLQKFLVTLRTPRPVKRKLKRKKPTEEKKLPDLNAGDVLLYSEAGVKRVAIVLGYYESQGWSKIVMLIVSKRFCEKPTMEQIWQGTGQIVSFGPEQFLGKTKYKVIGNMPVPEDYYKNYLCVMQKMSGEEVARRTGFSFSSWQMKSECVWVKIFCPTGAKTDFFEIDAEAQLPVCKVLKGNLDLAKMKPASQVFHFENMLGLLEEV